MKGIAFAYNRGVLVVFALVGTLLLTGYRGFTHDAVLYVAQAINELDPGSLSQDLFFLYGSQERFTVFPELYAALIDTLGVSTATLTLFLLSRVLFAVALVALVMQLVGREARLAALLGVLVLAGDYGGGGIFAIGESFVTARSLAEPLVVGGLALAMAQRRFLALLLFAASALFHLLAAIGPMLTVLLLGFGRRGGYMIVAGIAALLTLAWLRLEPFSWLYQRYDPAWWSVITERNDYAVMASWSTDDWSRLLLDIAVLLAAREVVTPGAKRLLCYLLLVALALFALAAIGEAFQVKLLFALQLWRVHAWLHLLAAACALPLALQWYRTGFQLAALILLLAVLFLGLPLLLAAAVFRWWIEKNISISEKQMPLRVLRALFVTVIIASIAIPLLWLGLGGNVLLLKTSLHFWLLYGTLAAWVWLTLRRERAGFYTALIPVLAITAVTFDRRSPLVADLMSGSLNGVFAQHIDKRSVTYWHNSLEVAWVARHLPSYYADKQGAGVLFNHDTAMEFSRRTAQLGFLEDQWESCVKSRLLSGEFLYERCELTYSDVTMACRAAPELDYVVAQQEKPDNRAVAVTPVAEKFLNLYACENVTDGG